LTKLEAGAPVPLGYAPGDEVSDFLERHRNYFPELEAAADEVRARAALPRRYPAEALGDALAAQFAVAVEWVAPTTRSSVVRSFDPLTRRLLISTDLGDQAAKFQLAHVLGLCVLDGNRLHERLTEGAAFRHVETRAPGQDPPRQLLRRRAAPAVPRVLRRGPAHALRRRPPGVLVRVVVGGGRAPHVQPRRSAGRRPAAALPPGRRRRQRVEALLRLGAALPGRPRLVSEVGGPRRVHDAGPVITKQYSEIPDGHTYFCFAKVISQPVAGSLQRGVNYAIGLGTRPRPPARWSTPTTCRASARCRWA
jgi:hypothetical protein